MTREELINLNALREFAPIKNNKITRPGELDESFLEVDKDHMAMFLAIGDYLCMVTDLDAEQLNEQANHIVAAIKLYKRSAEIGHVAAIEELAGDVSDIFSNEELRGDDERIIN